MNGLLCRICTAAAFQKAKAEVIDAMVIFKACCNRGRHESKLKKYSLVCLLMCICTSAQVRAEIIRVFLELNFYDLSA